MLKLLLVLAGFQASAADSEYFLLPAAARLEGVGAIYGLAAGAPYVVGGASFGQVEAQGLMIHNIPVISNRFRVRAGFGNLSKARFNTNYGRGFTNGSPFEQEVSGQAYGIGLQSLWLKERLIFEVGMVQSEVNLDKYYLSGVEVVRPNKSNYHPVKTDSKSVSVKWDSKPERTFSDAALNLGLSAVTAEGRAGQSDQLLLSYDAELQIPVVDFLSLHPSFRWSDALITKKASRYADPASVTSALGTNCTSLTDAEERSRCQTLENELAAYIAASNSHGTALPAGGSGGVRSFDELSLRAAHTRVASLEARVRIHEHVQLVPSYDLGWSADKESEVFDRAVQAYGVALRAPFSKFALRLAYAQSNEQSAWYFLFER
ncbi:MAG: hypothetical protein AB7F86_19045 [Bdellovibrionales bacterium]